ncbi:MAG: hypothetical protein AB7G28_22720 [Pirellulales bacterium]
MAKKTDNGDMGAKLSLRRYFLRTYHADDPPRVIDCCSGSGRIWAQLRREFDVASYWPLDVKPQKGRLRVDSTRVIAQRGWTENVVDVDTYGSPWKHWDALLPCVMQPTTVFLTFGQLRTGTVGSLGDLPLRYMGLGKLAKRLPAGFHVKLRELVLPYAFRRAQDFRVSIVDARECSAGNARYIGVRLNPAAPHSSPAAESPQ